jgi:hypothetical protein
VPHPPTVTRSTCAEVQLIPQKDLLGGIRMVHPDDYEFSSPADFGTYAVGKHPSLVSILLTPHHGFYSFFTHFAETDCAFYFHFLCQAKHYVLDFFKLHNAQMMRDVTDFRRSLMKRNAKFFDWFVENVGIQNIQMMHKKPNVINSPLSTQSNQSERVSNQGNVVFYRNLLDPLFIYPKPLFTAYTMYIQAPQMSSIPHPCPHKKTSAHQFLVSAFCC